MTNTSRLVCLLATNFERPACGRSPGLREGVLRLFHVLLGPLPRAQQLVQDPRKETLPSGMLHEAVAIRRHLEFYNLD